MADSQMPTTDIDPFEAANIGDILDKINSFVSISDVSSVIPESELIIDYSSEESLREAGFGTSQIMEINRGLAQGVDIKRYAKQDYNWMQMREIRYGLALGLDVSHYENPLFSATQMHEIRFGLVTNLDVESYAKLYLSTTDMDRIKRKLYAKSYKLNPNQFGRTVYDDATGILVRFRDDCLKAYITLPKEGGTPITREMIDNILEERYIVHGIQEDVISQILRENIREKEMCIAIGTEPSKGKDGYYELFFENGNDHQQFIAPDDMIDYTAVNTAAHVTPNQLLVKYHLPETEVYGMTVSGIQIDGEQGRNLPLLRGVGFRYDKEQNAYYATKQGCPTYNKLTGTLNVFNVHDIPGDVSYYQSVEYDGTIHIHGNVRSLATVRATGDIIVDGFVENASLFAEGDIVIKNGANAGGKGVIVAGGSLKGKFFENANLRAKGVIEGNYFLNCDIITDERLKAHGKKARIMGGYITAAISVEAVTIGNYMGVRTVLNIGDLAELEHRILAITKSANNAAEQLNQLYVGKQKLDALLGSAANRSNELYNKTMAAVETTQKQLDDYNREIDRLTTISSRAEKAYVKIHKELQEGVVFIINGNKKKVEKTITNGITLMTEKARGR